MGDQSDPLGAAWHVLRTSPWLEGCDDVVVDQLAAAARLQKVPRGAVVAVRGQVAEHLFVVAEGVIELGMVSAAGKRYVAGWLGRGQFFGLIPVLEHGPMIHTATALRPVRLLSLARTALLQALRDHPRLALRLLDLVCRRARVQYEALAGRSLLTLPTRLMRVLVAQLQDYPDGRILVRQADLAAMLGVARQSLNLELRKLAHDGVIALGRGHIRVLDRAVLARDAGSVE